MDRRSFFGLSLGGLLGNTEPTTHQELNIVDKNGENHTLIVQLKPSQAKSYNQKLQDLSKTGVIMISSEETDGLSKESINFNDLDQKLQEIVENQEKYEDFEDNGEDFDPEMN